MLLYIYKFDKLNIPSDDFETNPTNRTWISALNESIPRESALEMIRIEIRFKIYFTALNHFSIIQ